ncbi:MAG: hypothetical protein HZB16_20205 [Armatimonadetes bacterium]|nr:hypothetical protein [Armatimonadota bacterium]
MRVLRMAVTVGLVVVLAGCGAGDANSSSIIDRLPTLILGEWLRDQESSDSGQTWVDRNDDLRTTYFADGTWADSRGRTGTYVLYRDKMTVIWPGHEVRFLQIRVIAQGRRFEYVYYTTDQYTAETEYRARLTKLTARK